MLLEANSTKQLIVSLLFGACADLVVSYRGIRLRSLHLSLHLKFSGVVDILQVSAPSFLLLHLELGLLLLFDGLKFYLTGLSFNGFALLSQLLDSLFLFSPFLIFMLANRCNLLLYEQVGRDILTSIHG